MAEGSPVRDAEPSSTRPQAPIKTAAPGGDWDGIARWEWAAVAGVLLACGAFVWNQTRHYWFRTDDWLFLGERATSLRDLFRPHGGHLTATALVAYKIMLALFGLRQYAYADFRVVAFSLMVLALWWIMRRRGADPVIALAVVAYLGVLSSSVENKVVSIGVYVSLPAILLSFLIIERYPRASRRDLFVVAVLLFVAGVSNTYGDIGIVALTLVVVGLARYRRSWLLLCAVYAAAFAIWSFAYRSQIAVSEPHHRSLIRKALDVPIDVARVTRDTIGQLTFPGSGIGVLLALALVVLVAWAAWRGRLHLFELAAITTVVLTFAGYSLNRLHAPLGSGTASLRYADPLALFLIPALLPLASIPRRWFGRGVVIAVVLAVATAQANEFSRQADKLAARASIDRTQVTAARQLIIDGEPFVHQPLSILEVGNGEIANLAHEQGWGSAKPAAFEVARGLLRIGVAIAASPDVTKEQEAAPRTPSGSLLRDCVKARPKEPLVLRLVAGRSSSILLRRVGAKPAPVVLRTRDRFGTGRRVVSITLPTVVVVVTPDSGFAQLSLTPTKAEAEVCADPR